MKKRVVSLVLTLVMLLGLLPTTALAVQTEPAGTVARVAMAPAPEEEAPAQLLAAGSVSVSPTLTLGAAKSYQGEDLATEITPGQWTGGPGNYAVTTNGLTLQATETAKSTAATYLLQPFTISVNVPARTAYTVAFKVSGVVDRGSEGSSVWFSELENCSATDIPLSTQANVELRSNAVARSYGNSRNYRFSPAGFAYITFDNTTGTGAKTVTRDCAWLLGANKPKSVSDSYLHQMDATLTLTVDLSETRAVKSITYNPNYTGVTEDDYGLQVTADSPVTLFVAPTWTGYTFKGWKDAADNTLYAGGAAYAKDVGTTLTAQWEAKKSTVTFNYQGATGGKTETSRTVTYGQPYGTLPTPTRTGYDFVAWGTTSAGGYAIQGTTPVYLTEDHTLYAIWQSKEATISFDANGGSPSYQVTMRGDKLGDQPFGVTVTRPGYTLDGWYTAKTGGTKVDKNTAPHAAGARVYARWAPAKYTVTLSPSGGSVSATSATATYDSTYTGLPTTGTKAGYQFDGWYTAASGGSKVVNGTKVTQTANHTLYAHWVKPYWTIIFDAGGGYPATTTRRIDQGTALGELPVVARTGYDFTGWSPSASTTTKPTTNTTYTAQWRANTYNVTYNPNGGTGGGAGTATFDAAYSCGTPTRPGYTFKGWSTTSGGSAASKCATAKDHTVYANWQANKHTVTFAPGTGGSVSTPSKQVTYGSPYGSLPTPTNSNSGVEFRGWLDESGNPIHSDTIVQTDEDHTLTANWEQKHEHKISPKETEKTHFAYDLNGCMANPVRASSTDIRNPFRDGTAYQFTRQMSTYKEGYYIGSGSYYLSRDLDLGDNPLYIAASGTGLSARPAEINICLNGFQITGSASSIICVDSSSGSTRVELNICDCKGSGGVSGSGECLAVKKGTNPKYVNLYGGTFTTTTGTACVDASDGYITIDGAAIINENTAADSYALFSEDNDGPHLVIRSGEVRGYNGVQVGRPGSLSVSGGTITGTGGYGINNQYTTTVSGGTVTGKTYGIYNHFLYDGASIGTLTIKGGAITGTEGSGIYNNGKHLTVSGGTITGASGYGIENHAVPFELSGSPVIEGSGGGIYLDNGKTVTVNGALSGAFSVVTETVPTQGAPMTITSGDCADNFTASAPGYDVRKNGDNVELYVSHKHLPCGKGETCAHSGSAHAAAVEFEPVSGGSLNTGSYYLTENSGTVTIPSGKTVNLCLNGKTPSSITVNGTLNVCNCGGYVSPAVTISGGTLNQYSGVTANVTHTSGTWNFYGGTLAGSGDITLGGQLYLLDAPVLDSRAIQVPVGQVVHLGSGLKQPATSTFAKKPYNIKYAGTLTADNPQVTLTEGWSTLTGANLTNYFKYTGSDKAVLAIDGGEVVLRFRQVNVSGGGAMTCTAAGKLSALPPKPAQPAGKVWDGWYTASTGGTKVTTSTVLTDGATLYPRWVTCTHTNSSTTTVAATCTAAGSAKTVCKDCGHVTEATIAVKSHTYGTAWHKDELNHWHECTVCGFRDQTAAHTWGTPTESGDNKVYTCTCGATKSEAIPKYTVTYEKDEYTTGTLPTQAAAKEGGKFTLNNGTGLSRAGYTFGGWQLLDDKGNATGDPLTGQFTMPARDVRFRVVWKQKTSYTPNPGETVVLPDGTTITKADDGTVTIDQDGSGQAVTTVDPNGSDVIIQTGDPSQKPSVTVPAGSTIQSGDGPKVTLPATGIGAVDPSGAVNAPVGSIVTDSEGNKVEITGENPGTIDPSGSVTFPEGTDGKVTVTPVDGEPQDMDVTGGTEGVESSGEAPLPDTPTVLLPEGGDKLSLEVGQEPKKIEVTIAPEGTELPTLTWGSSDSRVVTVSDDGTVTVVGSGNATITITPPDGGEPVTVSVHVHQWDTQWWRTDTHHWHRCLVESCSITDYSTCGLDGVAYGAHSYDNGDDVTCNACKFERRRLEGYSAPGEGDGYSINYTDETITVIDGYEVSTADDGSGNAVTGGQVTPGATLYIRKSADATHGSSEWVELPIPSRPTAPEGVEAVDESVADSNDGKITGLTAGTAYEISKDGGQSWEDATVTGTEITGLAPGSYQVRAKATDASFTGQPTADLTVAQAAEMSLAEAVTAAFGDSAAYDAGSNTITVLDTVTLSTTLEIPNGAGAVTLNLKGHDVTGPDDGAAVNLGTSVSLSVTGSGTLRSPTGRAPSYIGYDAISGSGDVVVMPGVTVKGGDGYQGGLVAKGGYPGGNGIKTTGTVVVYGAVYGGDGGRGYPYANSAASGAAGGSGVIAKIVVNEGGTIQGGKGGAGIAGGTGGNGGNGVSAECVRNTGSITAGAGGSSSSGTAGTDGTAIVGGTHDGWTAWDDAASLPPAAGNYYLTTDVTLSATWSVPSGETTLCLNGHVIRQTGSVGVMTVPSGATLNLYDCSEGSTGTITHASGTTGRGVYNAGTFHMYGGSVTGNISSGDNGGGVYIYRGTFHMHGGSVTGNKAIISSFGGRGGGVFVGYSANFNMYGGEIKGNHADQGGGVLINNDPDDLSNNKGKVNLAGGEITGNTATSTIGGVNVPRHYQETTEPRLIVSGNMVITDNKVGSDDTFADSNLYVSAGRTFAIGDDGLTEGANIGVSPSTTNGLVFTSGWGTNMSGKTITDYFTSDDSALTLGIRDGEGVLGYTVTYAKPDDVTGTAPTDNGIYLSGETVTVSTEKPYTKDGYTQIGWSTAENSTETVSTYTMTAADATFYPVFQEQYGEVDGTHTVETTYGTAETLDLSTCVGYYTGTTEAAGKFTYAISDAPAWAGVSGDTLTVASTAPVGNYTLSVTATEKAPQLSTFSLASTGTGPVTFTVTVKVSKAAQAAPGANEGYSIDYAQEKVTVTSGYEINTKSDGTGTTIGDGAAITPGTTLYIRKSGNATHQPSDWIVVTVPARPAAPSVTAVNETLDGNRDGKLTGLSTDTVYEISDDAGLTWVDAEVTEDGEITGLAPGSYQVRAKATDDAFAGQIAGVSIATGDEATYTLNVTAPTFDAVYEGYTQPATQAITIQDTGNTAAAITAVTVSAPDKFTIGGSGDTVPAGGSIDTWTIQPAAGLDVGTHTADITVTHDGGETSKGRVTFTVRALEHTWTWTITTEPTMDAPGEATHTCPGDDHHAAHSETGVEVPALSDRSVWTEDEGKYVEPTEDAEGERTYTSEYGMVTVTLPKLDLTHAWTWAITTEPTMDAPGKATHACPGDDHHAAHSETGVEVPALSDTTVWTEDEDQRVEPTETTPGSKTYTSQYGSVTVTLPKLDLTHTWSWDITTEPTMDAPGKATHACPGDDHHDAHSETGVEVPALSDRSVWTEDEDQRVEPTETTPGSKTYTSQYGSVTVTLPKLDLTHDWTWTITTEPTLDAPGEATHACPGDEYHPAHSETGVAVPALSDTTVWTEDEAQRVEPAETTPGSKTYTSEYGEVTVTIPATGPATCTVIFDSMGGSQVTNQAVTAGGKATEPAAPARQGFTFGGWYTEQGCVHRWDFESAVTGEMFLYAKWTPTAHSISGTVTEGANESTTAVAGATVKLTQGNTTVATTTTNSQGKYSFTGVVPGNYNVVAEKDGKTMIILVSVTNAHATEKNLAMPSDNVNSVLEVVKSESVTTPDVVVGKLDVEAETVAKAETDKDKNVTAVTVTMTVQSKEESDETIKAQAEAIQEQIKLETQAVVNVEYMEIIVTKEVKTTQVTAPKPQPITQTQTLLEIVIPFDFTGKDRGSVKVYRYHDNQVDNLATRANADGEKIVLGTDYITIYANKFSTYAVGYENLYNVAVETDGHGTAKATPESATQGTWITLTATPDSGYRLKEWQVDGEAISGNRFQMPAKDVIVKAVFEEGSSSGTGSGNRRPNRGDRGDKADETTTVCPKDNTCPVHAFTDADVDAWYHDGVHYCVEKGLMQGTSATTFEPATPTSRAMIATILWRLQGSPVVNYAMDYADVKEETWYTEAVRWATGEGIVKGYDNGKFGPDDPITREQLATMLWRYAKATGRDVSVGEDTNILSYVDVSEAGEWAIPALQWATGSGIITGKTGGTLDPTGQATRAEAAAMLQRFCAQN